MKRQCHGDLFIADGLPYYSCLLQRSVVQQNLKQGDECPLCGRVINACERGEVETEKVTVAIIRGETGGALRVELPQ